MNTTLFLLKKQDNVTHLLSFPEIRPFPPFFSINFHILLRICLFDPKFGIDFNLFMRPHEHKMVLL